MMLMLIQKEMFILQKAVLFIRGGMILLLNFSDAELRNLLKFSSFFVQEKYLNKVEFPFITL
jgi:hypothetical protein